MPTQRLNIATGENVTTYDRAEAYNLAARMLGVSFTELGIFAIGVLAGMHMADIKFKRAPTQEGIDPEYGYAAVAMAMDDLQDDFNGIRRKVVIEETEKGPVWLKKKCALIEEMLLNGKNLNEDLDKHIKRIEEEKIKQADTELAGQVKEKTDDTEKA